MLNAFPDEPLPSGILRVIEMRISSLTSHFCSNAGHNAGKRLRVDLDMQSTATFGTLDEMHG